MYFLNLVRKTATYRGQLSFFARRCRLSLAFISVTSCSRAVSFCTSRSKAPEREAFGIFGRRVAADAEVSVPMFMVNFVLFDPCARPQSIFTTQLSQVSEQFFLKVHNCVVFLGSLLAGSFWAVMHANMYLYIRLCMFVSSQASPNEGLSPHSIPTPRLNCSSASAKNTCVNTCMHACPCAYVYTYNIRRDIQKHTGTRSACVHIYRL